MNLFCGKLFHSEQRIRIITLFGLKYFGYPIVHYVLWQPHYNLLNVSLMRFPGVPTFRCTMSIIGTGLSKGCTASITRTGIMDCNSTGVL